jgi:predicted deacylase
MAITFPRSDILTLAGFSPPHSFEPVSRQEISRLARGTTIGKDFGPALWHASFTTEELRNDDAVEYQAVLASLDGVINIFEAWDLRRPNPRRYTDGSAADGVLNTVNANNKALSLSGLNAGQIVSRGDYLSFTYGSNRALHQAMETVAANGSGLTAEFEVRPHLRPGWTLASVVNLKAPRGLFTLMPGTVAPKQTRYSHATVSFQAGQYLE